MWYRYTTTGTTTMTVDTCGSSYDTMIAVFTGSCGSLTQVACNDDAGANGPCPNGLMSYVSFTPTANTTYMIRVSGYNGATGSFNVRASGGVGNSNTPPTVAISAPTNGATFANGATITFTGSASDTQDGSLTSAIAWTSSVQGSIVTGGTFSRTLNAGAHTITATVTDSGGLTSTSSVSITVQSGGGGLNNETCASAIAITNGVAVSGTNVGAVNDATASCGGSLDVWYRYTATGSKALTFDTCGSGFDTQIAIYTGTCGALTEVGCNDDNGG
ncbi:MAG: Ig-like domain-containing protein, partial [bacterium]